MKIYVAEFKGRPTLSRYTVIKETAKLFMVDRDAEQVIGGYIRANKQVHKKYDNWFHFYDDAIKWLIDQACARVLALNADIETTEASIADLERRLDS